MFEGLEILFIVEALFCMGLGVIFIKWLKYQRKEKGVVRGQKKFSFEYWVKDNWYDITLHFLLAFISIAFTNDFFLLIGSLLPVTQDVSIYFKYFLLGAGSQGLLFEGIKKLFR
jgi:hypothetical protein